MRWNRPRTKGWPVKEVRNRKAVAFRIKQRQTYFCAAGSTVNHHTTALGLLPHTHRETTTSHVLSCSMHSSDVWITHAPFLIAYIPSCPVKTRGVSPAESTAMRSPLRAVILPHPTTTSRSAASFLKLAEDARQSVIFAYNVIMGKKLAFITTHGRVFRKDSPAYHTSTRGLSTYNGSE
ncbi:hypothetical protein BC835DRAFT_836882 [Cytidiella melzeri]|nr:hypothetical protein BC835DRAFT_836882 [Cytidiella melzeri]